MAKESFEQALTLVLQHEGGYVDHPSDPGGATNLGITRATLAAWRGKPVTKAQIRTLTRAEAAAIYRARYWDAIKGDDLPPGPDLALFDYAVNSGPARAVRSLQKALGMTADGVIGPETLRALAQKPPGDVMRALSSARRGFLKALPTFSTFGRGWMLRVDETEAEAYRLAARFTPKPQQENPVMDTTKSFFTSKTVWANIIGFAALVLSIFGYNTSGLDAQVLSEQILQGIGAASFVLSTLFRVFATKKIA